MTNLMIGDDLRRKSNYKKCFLRKLFKTKCYKGRTELQRNSNFQNKMKVQ